MFPGLLQGVRKQYSTCRNYTVDYLFVSQFKVRVRITLDTSFDKINSFRNLGGFRKSISTEIWGASEFHFISRNLPLLHWRSDQVAGAGYHDATTMLNYNKRTIGYS